MIEQYAVSCPTCKIGKMREGFSDYKAHVCKCEIIVREIPSIVCDHCGFSIRNQQPNYRAREFVESFMDCTEARMVTVVYSDKLEPIRDFPTPKVEVEDPEPAPGNAGRAEILATVVFIVALSVVCLTAYFVLHILEKYFLWPFSVVGIVAVFTFVYLRVRKKLRK